MIFIFQLRYPSQYDRLGREIVSTYLMLAVIKLNGSAWSRGSLEEKRLEFVLFRGSLGF